MIQKEETNLDLRFFGNPDNVWEDTILFITSFGTFVGIIAFAAYLLGTGSCGCIGG